MCRRKNYDQIKTKGSTREITNRRIAVRTFIPACTIVLSVVVGRLTLLLLALYCPTVLMCMCAAFVLKIVNFPAGATAAVYALYNRPYAVRTLLAPVNNTDKF